MSSFGCFTNFPRVCHTLARRLKPSSDLSLTTGGLLLGRWPEILRAGETELRDSEVGRRVEESFQQLEADRRELLGVFRPYGTWDHVLFVLRMFTRAVVGASRFCEMFYVYGLGHSGKDVLFLILTAFLSRLEGKRLVWASEVPPHDDLNVDFIKPFCEQAGAPICSRDRRDPLICSKSCVGLAGHQASEEAPARKHIRSPGLALRRSWVKKSTITPSAHKNFTREC